MMGACCQKQPLLPETDNDIQDNLVREQTNKFNDIYEIVGEPLGTGAISTIWKIRKKESALGGSSQQEFVRRKKRRSHGEKERIINDKASDTCTDESWTRNETYYALKEINVDKVDGKNAMKFIRNEVEFLKTLDHPGIVRAFETFELGKRLAIVMELCRGGDLSTRKP